MKHYTLQITVDAIPRGNHHDTTSSDYAYCAAAEIEREFAEQFSWLEGDLEAMARNEAISIAAGRIQIVLEKGIGGERIGYKIIETLLNPER